MLAMLGTIETTNLLLIIIINILAVSLILLKKIKNAVEISRNLELKRHFGRPYHEATRAERRGELIASR
jgi:hypothetical protein